MGRGTGHTFKLECSQRFTKLVMQTHTVKRQPTNPGHSPERTPERRCRAEWQQPWEKLRRRTCRSCRSSSSGETPAQGAGNGQLVGHLLRDALQPRAQYNRNTRNHAQSSQPGSRRRCLRWCCQSTAGQSLQVGVYQSQPLRVNMAESHSTSLNAPFGTSSSA